MGYLLRDPSKKGGYFSTYEAEDISWDSFREAVAYGRWVNGLGESKALF